jgi:adenosine deaminase
MRHDLVRLLTVAGAMAGTVIAAGAAPLHAGEKSPAPRLRTTAEAQVARYVESIRDDPSHLLAFLAEMPKGADLHSHLSGAVYAESLLGWAAEDGDCLDATTLALSAAPCDASAGRPPASAALQDQTLYRRTIDAWSMRNWERGHRSGHDQFFDTFDLAFLGTSGRTGDMLAEVTRRAAAGRVSYLELMLTPEGAGPLRLGAALGWDEDFGRLRERALAAGMEDVVAAYRAQIDAAEKRRNDLLGCGTPAADPGCQVEVRWLYQVLRGFPREQVFAQILAGFESARRDPRVVGLNLVMPEDWLVPQRDFSLHMRMIDALKKSYPRVHVSLHAGELWRGLVPPEQLRFHIRESIEVGHAERIGHGVAVMYEKDPLALLGDMARRGVMVEICLTSNDGILGVRGRDHPLRAYLEHGVPVSLSTDDEGVSRSDITREYMRAVQDQGLGYVQLKRMARTGLEHAFVDDVTRERLLRDLDVAFRAFESRAVPRGAHAAAR